MFLLKHQTPLERAVGGPATYDLGLLHWPPLHSEANTYGTQVPRLQRNVCMGIIAQWAFSRHNAPRIVIGLADESTGKRCFAINSANGVYARSHPQSHSMRISELLLAGPRLVHKGLRRPGLQHLPLASALPT